MKAVHRDDLRAYVFRGKERAVAIAWCGTEQTRRFTLAAGVRAYDIMGNELPAHDSVLTESPVYLVSTARTTHPPIVGPIYRSRMPSERRGAEPQSETDGTGGDGDPDDDRVPVTRPVKTLTKRGTGILGQGKFKGALANRREPVPVLSGRVRTTKRSSSQASAELGRRRMRCGTLPPVHFTPRDFRHSSFTLVPALTVALVSVHTSG